jgi:hypothetical protein
MDGQTLYVPRVDLDKIRAVNEQLTKETGLTIEETVYSKMCVRDVNNYLAVYADNSPEHEHIKLKGDYEIYKEYHKDPSTQVVPLAVKNYLIYGIPIKETIMNDKNIFDFCLRLKVNSSSRAMYKVLENNEIVDKCLDRTTRYYISTNGGTLYKDFGDGRITGVNVGYGATLFNKYIEKPFEEYKINYNFYISEAQKLIDGIIDRQLSLFD